MLPHFLGLGAQKAGTTSLFRYLHDHPQIFIPDSKEVNFFFRDHVYKRGIAFYETKFPNKAASGKVLGEISPNYLYHNICIDRIKQHIPKLKFIILIRNPIDRAYSNYWMEVLRGNEHLSFREAIHQEQRRIALGINEKNRFSYVHRGFYYQQIKAYMEAFRDSEFLILLSEDLRTDRIATLKKTYRFLGVADTYEPTQINKEYHKASDVKWSWLNHHLKNPTKTRTFFKILFPTMQLRSFLRRHLNRINSHSFTPPPVDPDIRADLAHVFFQSNMMLSDLVGRDLSHWK